MLQSLTKKIPRYLRLATMELELLEIIKRKADLRTAAELSRYFRHQVEKEAVTIYLKNIQTIIDSFQLSKSKNNE